MRKLTVSTFSTLDGVMQAPGGPGEDDSGGFAHGGWSVNYWDEHMAQVMGESTSAPFDLRPGHATYDIFASYWPACIGRAGRQTAERRHQVRRVAGSSRAGVGALGTDPGRCGPTHRGAQAGRWARPAGVRQREPDPDTPAPQRRRPVPPVGLPRRCRLGETSVLGRRHPRRAQARRQHGLHHGSRDRYVRAGRRDRQRDRSRWTDLARISGRVRGWRRGVTPRAPRSARPARRRPWTRTPGHRRR